MGGELDSFSPQNWDIVILDRCVGHDFVVPNVVMLPESWNDKV